MVRPSRTRVDQPSGDPRDQETVRDLELESLVQLLLVVGQHVVELFGLDDGSGESVEDEPDDRIVGFISVDSRVNDEDKRKASPVGTLLVGLQLIPDHPDHDLIRDEPPSVHDLLGLLAERRLLGDL